MRSFIKLISALFTSISHYTKVLPYNLSWAIDPSPVAPFLSNNPISVFDIGARGGPLGELDSLAPHIAYTGFDADEDSADTMNAHPPSEFNSFRAFPYFIGDVNDKHHSFYLYKNLAESSSLKPAHMFKKYFARRTFGPQKSVSVPSMTLNTFLKQHTVNPPDILKLDTQGSELAILKKATSCFDTTFLIESEVEFYEMYEGQDLFYDLAHFLQSHDYQLLYLNRAFLNRNGYAGPARGQMVFGDALFGKNERALKKMSTKQLAKYAICLINYGHLDYAYQIVTDYPAVKKLVPTIMNYFNQDTSLFTIIKKGVCMQVDKIACLWLFLRRTNQLPADSDRSWPLR